MILEKYEVSRKRLSNFRILAMGKILQLLREWPENLVNGKYLLSSSTRKLLEEKTKFWWNSN